MTDLTARFAKEAPSGHPNVTPKDASTLILLDRSGPEPKVLLGKRHHGHIFLPGKYVFPGGSVDASDRRIATELGLHPKTEERLMRQMRRPSPGKARALALAAVRETFEETGLLLGAPRSTPLRAPAGPWAAFADAGLHPDLTSVHYVARAVTPPRRSRRYDTRFFTADVSAIAREVPGKVGPDSELVELVWIPLSRARTLDVLAITELVLEDLQAQLEAGFSHDLPIPYYRLIHGRRIREMI